MSNEFGKFIKEKRKERGVTVRNLANATKLSTSYISSLENGNRKAPKEQFLLKFAKVLSLDKNEIGIMYNLAAKSRGEDYLAVDIARYINKHSTAYHALRLAKDFNITNDDWKKISEDIRTKYK